MDPLIFQLPQEMLEHICQNLLIHNVNTLNNLAQTCHYFNHVICEFKKYNMRPELIQYNLIKFNCTKNIFISHRDSKWIKEIFIDKNIVIATSVSTIQAWDMHTRTTLWFYSNLNIKIYSSAINHEHGRIVYSGYLILNSLYDIIDYDSGFIKIIDIKTGTLLTTIKYANSFDPLITVINNLIIGKLDNSQIYCWNLDGNFIRKYQAQPAANLYSKLLATNQYIIDINGTTNITVINQKTQQINQITTIAHIESTYIIDNWLYCGLRTNFTPLSIIDLANNQVIKTYEISGFFHNRHNVPNTGILTSVAVTKDMAFIAHECGKVIGFDLKDKKYQVLVDEKNSHPKLMLHEQYLFIILRECNSLHIWDIKQMQQINVLSLTKLSQMQWHQGTLLIAAGNSLTQFDFKVWQSRQRYCNEVESNSVDLNTIKNLFYPRPFGYNLNLTAHKMLPHVVRKNVINLNYELTLLHDQVKINHMFTSANSLITIGTNNIQIWNLDTKELHATYANFEKIFKAWAINGKIVYVAIKKSTANTDPGLYQANHPIIIIRDLLYKQKNIKIIHSQLNPKLITVTDNKIIAKLKSGKIYCWNFAGILCNKFISVVCDDLTPYFLANQQYICDINHRTITIIDQQTAVINHVTLASQINAAVLVNNTLFCALFRRNSTISDLVTLNLQSKIVQRYKIDGLFTEEDFSYNAGYITDLVVNSNQDRAFIAYKSGIVIGIDLPTLTFSILEQHCAILAQLKLHDHYLLIKFRSQPTEQSHLCIWDINRMEKINQLELNALDAALWYKNTLLISANQHLVQYDFNLLNPAPNLTHRQPWVYKPEPASLRNL